MLTNYLIQDGITSGRLANTNIVTGAIAFQVLILMLVDILIYLLINRFVIATVVIIVLFGGFSFANAQKYSQREEPVYLSDVSWLKNPKTLFSFVDTKTPYFRTCSNHFIGFVCHFHEPKILSWQSDGLESACRKLGRDCAYHASYWTKLFII